jgi:dTDP-4-dehydrorhamnose reductase
VARLLVIGGSGLVGSNIAADARGRHEVTFTYHRAPVMIEGCRAIALDVTDATACASLLAEVKPDIVVNSAACLSAPLLERDWARGQAINVSGTGNLVSATEKVGAVFVHISTDWVFAGDRRVGERYGEDDPIGPVNAYGRSKALAEDIVLRAGLRQCLVARTADVYGVNQSRICHATSSDVVARSGLVLGWAARLAAGIPVALPAAVYQSPSAAWALARQVLDLVETGEEGIFHCAGPDVLNRFELLGLLTRVWELDPKLAVEGSLEDLLIAFGFARGTSNMSVPANVALDVYEVSTVVGAQIEVRAGLKELRAVSSSLF